ncbi:MULTISPECIES: hypothetical protein [unclassified Bradyrhizobium]|uniref:hypothetical protein n=1 Tax=unclassified Bradyrhizobium TaxID=2631580 RepID=UPI001BAD4105|nr:MULTISPECIES: hypothetical protein [unclassified Bradyrhizobium]MBR1206026.1 hypothetical protein [Bradyrhizobium sp. AUGA SZCCT0124]MBR1314847.1 hypothetical protein [Bradyrhizobium sp. AUGA SZCCT0051]MBR1341818.1 hypothetical protein [Bradyrhizobium sp. AUGA SZCCT0105]MBR1358780.1 hypothetical protein [Bradyrhizobium sp. AUGA SZCCT0045]
MPATQNRDPQARLSGHVDRIEVLEPLRKSLGEVKETAGQFEQAQALLRAIERFSRTHAADRKCAGTPAELARRDERRLARRRLVARAVRGLRRTVLAAKGGASCR